jgi:metal-sulfur cluster biosynthetic enzyme
MIIQLNDPHFQEKTLVREALCQVLDPELMVNVIDLGLVYDIAISTETILVTMTLTSHGCPLGEAIEQGVKNAVGNVMPDREVKVSVVWEPQWTFEDISEAGRAQLGF